MFAAFHYRTFSLLSRQFFFIRTLLLYLREPKDIQVLCRFWIASPYVPFPLWRKFLPLFSYTETPSPNCKYSFNRPLCLSLNVIRPCALLSIKNFSLDRNLLFPHLHFLTAIPERLHDIPTASHPSPFPWSKSRRHRKPIFGSWFPQFQPSSVRVKLP